MMYNGTSTRYIAVYDKKIDALIEEADPDDLPFQAIKKKLEKNFPSLKQDFKGAKGVNKLYQKVHR